jgi:hypothetical protein
MSVLVERLAQTTPFDEGHVEAAVRDTATRTRHQGRRADSRDARRRHRSDDEPGLFELLAWLGPERTRARLTRLLEFLATRV